MHGEQYYKLANVGLPDERVARPEANWPALSFEKIR